MHHSANDTAKQPSSSDTNTLNLSAARKQILTVPLPDPITRNIETITSFQTQGNRGLPAHQRLLETITSFFGRSVFLYLLLLVLTLWIFSSFLDGLLPFDLPPFSWSEQGLDAAALLISTGVLVRQTRQENFAEQRSQLMLQLNLLSEQKIAKMISLLEELRADLPDVADRHDPEAEMMQEAADPIAVLAALQETLGEELALEAEAEHSS
jgi:uncharacterized membrane protein